MTSPLSEQIAAAAARLVVEEGLEYPGARRRAAHEVAGRAWRSSDLPRNEVIEDEVRSYLRLFHADTQPGELRALRQVCLRWMQRLAAHRPYLAGAVWRGTATRRSAIVIDLYCDDPKGTEIDIINQGIDYDVADAGGAGDRVVLTVADRSRELGEAVTLHLLLHDLDELRGALKPDARGRSWRGDLAALMQRMAEDQS